MIQNLVLNAVKFNRASAKRVELGFSRTKDKAIEIYVRDNGIGMAPRHQKQIFNVFQRLNSSAEFESGTGVGLAIVKRAVSRMHGSIRLESALGSGSTFYITLPIKLSV